MNQDRRKALTAEDLIRMYDLNNLKKDRRIIARNKDELVSQNKLIVDYVNAITKNIENLQDQVDGNITTWFLNGVPTLENSPASDWHKDTDKVNHLGDLYYDQATGYAYRFGIENDNYTWIKITDSDVTKALAIANSAQDTADSKRRTFVVEPTPPYEVGDIWIKEDKELLRCRATRKEGNFSNVDWILATDYTNDDYAKGVEAVLNQFKTEVTQNYTTKVQLETTKDSIIGMVETETTKTEVKILDLDNLINQNTNEMDKNYQDLNNKLDGYATIENVTTVTNRVENIMNSTEWAVNRIEDITINGVNKVHAGNGMSFDDDGLNFNRIGAKTGSSVDEAGMKIIDKTGSQDKVIQYTGYVTDEIAQEVSALSKEFGNVVNYAESYFFGEYIKGKYGQLEEIEDDDYGKGWGIFAGGDN